MSEFKVAVGRATRSHKPAQLRFFSFDARHLAWAAALYTAFCYVAWFATHGLHHSTDLLYPAVLAILTLAVMPGACIVVALCGIFGWSHDVDASRLFLIVLVSVAVYWFEVRRGLKKRNGQTPQARAAD